MMRKKKEKKESLRSDRKIAEKKAQKQHMNKKRDYKQNKTK
jgi:hypothetical protein